MPTQVIRSDGESFDFEVDAFRKHCLLNGLDDIGLTMAKMEDIRAFETGSRKHLSQPPYSLDRLRL
jgi:3-isopropylmalate/(R)-2-methylmalate dehydratase small subunit